MSDFSQINGAIQYIVPEVILLATVCLMFLAAPFLSSERGDAAPGLRHRWGILSLLSIAAAAFAWSRSATDPHMAGFFRHDDFVWFVRGLTLCGGALLVLILWDQIDDGHSAEAHACLLSILAGAGFVAAANDLIGLFLGLELVSIPTYVLLYLPRRDWLTREATIKYFLLSIFSSAFVLYALAWIFGLTGTTNLGVIVHKTVTGSIQNDTMMLKVALVLLMAGLSFRVTAVPFHFYAPDVFQGVTPASAAMLSVIPKVVGLTAMLRILVTCSGAVSASRWVPLPALGTLLLVLALLTMIVGNILALRQTHLQRLMAYSGIAHAGYMLTGLTVGDHPGISGITAMMFYVAVYSIATVGVFALISAVGTLQHPVRAISDLAGLGRTRPAVAILLVVCLFGLAGLPPTAGFLGKLNLFLSAWSEGSLTGRVLAVTLAVNAVIAACYYLRIIAVMYLDHSAATGPIRTSIPAMIAGGVCAAAAVVVFLAPQWLWDAAALVRG